MSDAKGIIGYLVKKINGFLKKSTQRGLSLGFQECYEIIYLLCNMRLYIIDVGIDDGDFFRGEVFCSAQPGHF